MSATDHKGDHCLCHTAFECSDIHERYMAQRDVLRRVDQFLTNGIALGYIRMPDADCPDPAKEVPGLVKAALAGAIPSGGS